MCAEKRADSGAFVTLCVGVWVCACETLCVRAHELGRPSGSQGMSDAHALLAALASQGTHCMATCFMISKHKQ